VSEVKRVKKVKKAKPTTDAQWQSRSGSLALSNRSAGMAEDGAPVLVGVVWEERKTDQDMRISPWESASVLLTIPFRADQVQSESPTSDTTVS
jgi:hypothetical protein